LLDCTAFADGIPIMLVAFLAPLAGC